MVRGSGGVPLALLMLLRAPGIGAQDVGTRTLCLSDTRFPGCANVVLVEAQGVAPLVRSTRSVRPNLELPPYEATPFGTGIAFELGLMRNFDERWAAGGVVTLGPGSTDALRALSIRGRRWVGREVAFDAAVGTTFVAGGGGRRAAGLLADARLGFRDDVHAGVRWEAASLDPWESDYGTFDPGGTHHALSVFGGLGGDWAIVGTTVATGAFVVLWFLCCGFEHSN